MSAIGPPDARTVLRDVFGFERFRGQQEEIVEHVAAGGDALVLMPTGGGKSLCYQIPGLLRPGTAVVISPLVALMHDQVNALRRAGVRAANLDAATEPETRREVERGVREGNLDLLYVAPERAVTERFLALLEAGRPALFAIDEAHCVSQWGFDFRPEYTALDVLAERFPAVPRIASTATADAATRRDIVEKLRLENGRQFVSSFDRPNIRYTVVDKRDAKRQFLDFHREHHEGHAGIVYCMSRKGVEATAKYLSKAGLTALPYHAGLEPETRAEHQRRFLEEEAVVIVATVAFGMGIDKPDVRFVAHLDLPKSLEAYYQETGRAGRDGRPADAFLTFGLQDVVQVRWMLASSGGDAAHEQRQRARLEALLAFCETAGCRRRVLLAYFDEHRDDPCGNCDACLEPVRTFDGTVVAQKLLSTVVRTGGRFGAGHLVEVLLGRASARVQRLGHDRISTFGIGTEFDEAGWRSVARQLVAAGHLISDPDAGGGLRLAPGAAAVLRGEAPVALREDRFGRAAPARARGTEAAAGETVARTLELFRAGHGAEAMAAERGLKRRTIEGHLAELVRRGDVDVEEATGLAAEEIDAIVEAAEALPDEVRGRLRPLRDALGGRYDYGTLKCVLAGRERVATAGPAAVRS